MAPGAIRKGLGRCLSIPGKIPPHWGDCRTQPSSIRSKAAALSYTLNGTVYTIQPGYTQTLQEDRAWAIEFNRGPNQGQARYGLQTGAYSFGANGSGWELFNRPVETTSQNSPANPPPPVTVPMNPSPTP